MFTRKPKKLPKAIQSLRVRRRVACDYLDAQFYPRVTSVWSDVSQKAIVSPRILLVIDVLTCECLALAVSQHMRAVATNPWQMAFTTVLTPLTSTDRIGPLRTQRFGPT